jgi:hypothetical protein
MKTLSIPELVELFKKTISYDLMHIDFEVDGERINAWSCVDNSQNFYAPQELIEVIEKSNINCYFKFNPEKNKVIAIFHKLKPNEEK